MTHVCKCFSHCFLNCFGCEVIDQATKEEKAAAKKALKEHRKKFLLTK